MRGRAVENLTKSERICSKRVIDGLFSGSPQLLSASVPKVASMAVYPVRAVFQVEETRGGCVPVRMMVSVSKRRFHHAVDRNRMKRLVRESYRRNKQLLWDAAQAADCQVTVAFVCMADRLCPCAQVEHSVRKILYRIKETLQSDDNA